MSQLKEIAQHIKNSGHNKGKLAVGDIDGILRGKVVWLDKFLSIAEGGTGVCDVVCGCGSRDRAGDHASITGSHTGYPGADAFIDLDTFRSLRWGHGRPFFLADFTNPNGEKLAASPRGLLKKIKKQ